MTTVQQHETSRSVPEPAAHDDAPLRDGVTVGLVTIIGGALAIMAAYGELFVDALVFLVAFAGLAVWAARSGSTRLRWAIAGLVALFVAINMVFAIPDLSHPESPAPFVATAVVVLGGVVTAVLAVLAARGRPASGRRVWPAAYGVVALLAAGSLVAAANVENDVAQPGDTEIVAADFAFPDVVEVGSTSTGVLVRNTDRGRHTFVVDGQNGAVEVPAGSEVRVPLELAPGSYRYYCNVPGHEAMEGTLVVR